MASAQCALLIAVLISALLHSPHVDDGVMAYVIVQSDTQNTDDGVK